MKQILFVMEQILFVVEQILFANITFFDLIPRQQQQSTTMLLLGPLSRVHCQKKRAEVICGLYSLQLFMPKMYFLFVQHIDIIQSRNLGPSLISL